MVQNTCNNYWLQDIIRITKLCMNYSFQDFFQWSHFWWRFPRCTPCFLAGCRPVCEASRDGCRNCPRSQHRTLRGSWRRWHPESWCTLSTLAHTLAVPQMHFSPVCQLRNRVYLCISVQQGHVIEKFSSLQERFNSPQRSLGILLPQIVDVDDKTNFLLTDQFFNTKWVASVVLL